MDEMHPTNKFTWIFLLLSSISGVCHGFSNWDNPFSEPGVIIGVIAGIIGLIVIIGVTIVLCRIFCCKDTACCSCCCCCSHEVVGSTDYLANIIPPKNKDTTNSNNSLNNSLNNSHPNNTRPQNNTRTRSRDNSDDDDDHGFRARVGEDRKNEGHENINIFVTATNDNLVKGGDAFGRSTSPQSDGASSASKQSRKSPSKNASASPRSSFNSKHNAKLTKKWSGSRGIKKPLNFIRGSSPRSSKSRSSFGKGKRMPELDDLPQFNWNPTEDPKALAYSGSFRGADRLPTIYGLKDKKHGSPEGDDANHSTAYGGAVYANVAYNATEEEQEIPDQGEDSDTDAVMAVDIEREKAQAAIIPRKTKKSKGHGARSGQYAYNNYNFDASQEDPPPSSDGRWEESSRAAMMAMQQHQNQLQEKGNQQWDASQMQETDLDDVNQWNNPNTTTTTQSSRNLTSHMQSQLSTQDDGHKILWGNLAQPTASYQPYPSAENVYSQQQAAYHDYTAADYTYENCAGQSDHDTIANPHFNPYQSVSTGSQENLPSRDRVYSSRDHGLDDYSRQRSRSREQGLDDASHGHSTSQYRGGSHNSQASLPKPAARKHLHYGGDGENGSWEGSRGKNEHSWQTVQNMDNNSSHSFGAVHYSGDTARRKIDTSEETEV